MNDTWWWVGGLIVAGLVAGTIASIAARRYLGAQRRRPAIREASGPVATLLFWLFVAAGLVAAIASASPTTIEDIPSDLLGWLPRLGVAGIILIAGFVIANVASTAVARTARRATGQRQPVLEAAVKAGVIIGAVVLALSQLGIDTTILDILITAATYGAAAAIAGIAIIGGRDIARSVAAGKAVTQHLDIGTRVTIGGHTGTVERFTATHVVLALGDGEHVVMSFRRVDDADIVIHS